MGFFKKESSVATQPAQTEAQEEKAVNKARLLATAGENKGAELSANQGASIRKVFGR